MTSNEKSLFLSKSFIGKFLAIGRARNAVVICSYFQLNPHLPRFEFYFYSYKSEQLGDKGGYIEKVILNSAAHWVLKTSQLAKTNNFPSLYIFSTVFGDLF